MITNADITLYNHYYDKKTRLDHWQRSVIRGVHFYVDHRVSIGDSGVNSGYVYKIRIPVDVPCRNTYIPEDEWKARGCDILGNWTLQNDDLAVWGECGIDIEKPADLQRLGKRYCKITSWSDNRLGSLPHWRIGGA